MGTFGFGPGWDWTEAVWPAQFLFEVGRIAFGELIVDSTVTEGVIQPVSAGQFGFCWLRTTDELGDRPKDDRIA